MSIYDEAFNDLLKYFHENKPLENIDDTLVKIEHGLERAKKVEELCVIQEEYIQALIFDRPYTQEKCVKKIKEIKKEMEELK